VNGALSLDIQVPLSRFDLSVAWPAGRAHLGIFGHSGSGKTTVLETIAGLRRHARGRILWGEETWLDTDRSIRLHPERRGVGYVPQAGLLFPHRNVLGNLLSGRRRAAGGAEEIPVDRVLRVLELEELTSRSVASLSGGERQRVALGRALCSGPRLMLLDEPLSGLDLPLRRRILQYLIKVREEFSIPTLYVSHEATEMRLLCDEMIVLESGRVKTRGAPRDVFARPEVFPMARREGFENVLEGHVGEVRDGAAELEIEPGLVLLVPDERLRRGERVAVGVRAEDLILATASPGGISAQNSVAGVVRDVHEVEAGESSVVEVVVGVGSSRVPLIVAVTRRACRQLGLDPGRPVHVIVKVQSFHLLARR